MKYVPNALSLSRIPLSVALFIFAMNEQWGWAATCMIVALITDGLDGAVARHFKVESDFGGKILEPFCDLTLLISAIGGLCVAGYWPSWVLLVAMIIQVVFEWLHRSRFVRLKRHLFYIHPLAFVGVVYVTGFVLLDLATADSRWAASMLSLYGAAWLVVAIRKQDRWMVWFRGPQPASPTS